MKRLITAALCILLVLCLCACGGNVSSVKVIDVDSSGGDGSLNPDSTYTDWNWILVRTNGGKWRHVEHGY